MSPTPSERKKSEGFVRGDSTDKLTVTKVVNRRGELMVYSEDEATWVKELGQPEEAQEEE